MNRRAFLRHSACAATALAFTPAFTRAAQAAAKSAPLFSALGVAGPLARAAELKAAGADYLVDSASNLLVPISPTPSLPKN